MIETKYDEIRDLINRGTFRAFLWTYLTDGTNLRTARYDLAIKSDEDEEERCRKNTFPADI